jgi:hypothetical protein
VTTLLLGSYDKKISFGSTIQAKCQNTLNRYASIQKSFALLILEKYDSIEITDI